MTHRVLDIAGVDTSQAKKIVRGCECDPAVEKITGCVCEGPGFCERHGIRKHKRLWELCRCNHRYFAAWEARSGPGQTVGEALKPLPRRKGKGLGDRVEQALTAIGITSERVERWLGRPCKCPERREKLNRLGEWAMGVLTGKKAGAAERLDEMTK